MDKVDEERNGVGVERFILDTVLGVYSGTFKPTDFDGQIALVK